MNRYYIASTHDKPNGVTRLEIQCVDAPSMDAAVGWRTKNIMNYSDCCAITNIQCLEHEDHKEADILDILKSVECGLASLAVALDEDDPKGQLQVRVSDLVKETGELISKLEASPDVSQENP